MLRNDREEHTFTKIAGNTYSPCQQNFSIPLTCSLEGDQKGQNPTMTVLPRTVLSRSMSPTFFSTLMS